MIRDLALVGTYPADEGRQAQPLQEYNSFLYDALVATSPGGEVRVLSSKAQGSTLLPHDIRVWDYGGYTIPFQISNALKPDEAVLFSIHFTSWGGLASNFMGLISPMLTQMCGHHTVVLLHHLPQTMNAGKAGYKLTMAHWLAIDLACRGLAKADVVCFTREKDADYFRAHYKKKNVYTIPLGLQGKPIWKPVAQDAEPTLLFLGNMGRSKNPEPVIRAFRDARIPGRFLVAGQSSHTYKGFTEGLAAQYASDKIRFLGYVPEPQIPELFHQSTLVVLPYAENPGTSAVFMQSAQYGRVALATPVFREMADVHGIRLFYYECESTLEEQLRLLMTQNHQFNNMALANYRAVGELDINCIALKYWELINREEV